MTSYRKSGGGTDSLATRLTSLGCRPPAADGVAPVTQTRLSVFHRMIRRLASCGAGSSGTGSDFDVRRANTQRWLRATPT
ncbi:MAG: hypothetical protein ACI9KE_004534 [Polyangiales bacterium]